MAIIHYPKNDLGKADYDWLKTSYHFSFADYHNPKRMGFGQLRVVNNDQIAPGTGFDFHAHRNMEIITFVYDGVITHEDSLGNVSKISAGQVQIMSAGTGVVHAEKNLESQACQLLQIWIKPHTRDVKPRWEKHAVDFTVNQCLKRVVSSDAADGAMAIHQNGEVWLGRMYLGQKTNYSLKNQVYIVVVEGALQVNDVQVQAGDGLEVCNEASIDLIGHADVRFILIDMP